jgi:hypothetical protein
LAKQVELEVSEARPTPEFWEHRHKEDAQHG